MMIKNVMHSHKCYDERRKVRKIEEGRRKKEEGEERRRRKKEKNVKVKVKVKVKESKTIIVRET